MDLKGAERETDGWLVGWIEGGREMQTFSSDSVGPPTIIFLIELRGKSERRDG